MSEVKNIPRLRFCEFRDNWGLKTLGDLGDIINGITYSPTQIQDNGVLVLRSSNIQNGRLNFEDNVYISVEKYNPVKKNDVLICVRNGSQSLIGKSALIYKNFDNMGFGAFMTVYRSERNPFLYHWFDTEKYYREVHKNLGATINSINGSDLKKFKVPFPSLPEQQKIADFLNAVDRRIELLEKKKTLLETYKKGVMKKIFSQEIRFKDDYGNDFPEWEEKKLGDVFEIQGGGTPDTTKPEYWDGEILWVTPTEIKQRFLKTTNRTISPLGLKNSGAKVLPKGTLLFTSRASIGDMSFTISECTTNQGFQSFLPNEKQDLHFLYYLISKNKKVFLSKSSGSTFLEISKKNIGKISLLFPTLSEQRRVSEFLSSLDYQIELIDSQIEKSKTWKKGLLQKMFV